MSLAICSSTAWKYIMSRSFTGRSSLDQRGPRRQVPERKSLRLHPWHVAPSRGLVEERVAAGQLGRKVSLACSRGRYRPRSSESDAPNSSVRRALRLLLRCPPVPVYQHYIHRVQEDCA